MKSHQVYLFRQTAVKYLNNKQKTEEMYPNTGHQNCGHMIKGDKQLPSLLPPTLFLSTQGASNFEMAAFLSGCISKTLFKGISQALKMIPRSAHYYWQECTEMLNIREGPALLFTLMEPYTSNKGLATKEEQGSINIHLLDGPKGWVETTEE